MGDGVTTANAKRAAPWAAHRTRTALSGWGLLAMSAMASTAAADICAYVPSVRANEIAILDLGQRRLTGAIAAPGAARDGVSVDGAGHAYVLQADLDTGMPVATAIDTASHTVTAHLPLPSCAYGRLRADPERSRLFVAEACNDSVRVLDLTGAPVATLPGCATVSELIAAPGGGLLVAAPRCDGLRRIDLAELTSRVAPLPAEGAVAALVPAPGGAIAVDVGGTVWRIGAGGAVEGDPLLALPPGDAILDAGAGPEAAIVYVLTGGGFGGGALYRIDLTAARAAQVPLAHAIGGRDRVAVAPADDLVLVTHYASGIVELVAAGQAVSEIAVPPGASGAAVFSADSCVPAATAGAAVHATAAARAVRAVPPGRAAEQTVVAQGRGVDEWFVDCSAEESGDGSSEHPWRTIAEAAQQVRGGGPAGDDDGRGDLVHVRGGPCQVADLGFKAPLGGPGPDCRDDDEDCTVFRGEPDAVAIVGGTSRRDGFLIRDGVDHLKLENFTFVGEVLSDPANAQFGEPVKVSGGGNSDIVLANLRVESGALVHDSGIKVLSEGEDASHDILIVGGEVRGVAGVGYTLGGPPDAPLRGVVLRATAAIGNGGDGYVVSRDSRGVADARFEGTLAEGNGGDGYDIHGAFDAAPEQVTVFSNVTARSNGPPDCADSGQGVGIKAWHSVQIDGALIEDNCQSGISLRRSESSGARDATLAVGTITNSTVVNNARVGGVQIDLSRARAQYTVTNCTLASDDGKSALSYLRRYACDGGENDGDACSARADCLDAPCGPGGVVQWDQSTLYRDNNGKLVSFVARGGQSRVCANDQAEVETCDIIGDCNFDFAVTIDELIKGINILLGSFDLPACAQFDRSGDQLVSVDELVTAVNVALGDTRTISTAPPD